jgi:hypothetical protein
MYGEDAMYGIDWPMSCEDPLLQEAMDIAMTYLEQVGILRLFLMRKNLLQERFLMRGAGGCGTRSRWQTQQL